MLHDLRHAIRALSRAPGFAAVVVATLALSIGATTTIYSVVRGVLLRPLPFADQERLVTLWQRAPGVGVDEDWFSISQYADIRDGTPSLDHVAITWGQEVTLTAEGTDPTRVGALQVSSSFFDVMGIEPHLGRRLTEEDDAPGATQKVLLGHEVFNQRFGADPQLVGSTIALDGQFVEIVGVMPPLVLDADTMPTLLTVPVFDLYLSFPLEVVPTTRGSENYNIIGKLGAGASMAQLETELLAVADGFTQDSLALAAGLTAGEDFWIGVVPLLEEVTGQVSRPLVLLLAATLILLLIACANVANLLLTRATTQQRELSIRASLGAPRPRMIRHALLESLLLAVGGGALGVLIAVGAVQALHTAAPQNLPRLAEVAIDPGVLLFVAGLCVTSSVIFGVGPAIRTAAADPGEVLREGSAAARTRSLWSSGASSALVVVQVALSMLLVVGAGLLVRTFWQLQAIDPGFAADQALSFRVSLAGERYNDPEARYDFYDQLFERAAAAPGATFSGGASLLPLTRGLAWTDFIVEGFNTDNPDDRIVADVITVTPGFFEAMNTDVIHGRAFEPLDSNEPLVVMVNRQFADRFWGADQAVGKWIATNVERPMTVIGVTETVRHYGPAADTRPAVFYPYRGRPHRSLFGVVGVEPGQDPMVLAESVRGIVRDLDAQVAISNIDSMRGRFRASLAQQQVLMWLLNFFGITAITLATVGLYGVLSFAVATQTREVGIRKALGAQRQHLYALVLRGAAAVTVSGLVLGLVAALATARSIQSAVFGAAQLDAVAVITAAALVLLTALGASLIPARRAARIDPMVALKQD